MNRRQTDLLDTNAFAKTCVLLDNAKMRESLKACEADCETKAAKISALESLLARAGSRLYGLSGAIESEFNHRDEEADRLIEEIDAILPATEVKYAHIP